MQVKVISLCFAGGYESIYEHAWLDAYFYDAFEEYSDDCQDYDDAMDVLNNNDYWDCNNKEYINL